MTRAKACEKGASGYLLEPILAQSALGPHLGACRIILAHLGRKTASLRHVQAICEERGRILAPTWAILEHLGAIWEHLGANVNHLDAILDYLGASMGHVGASRRHFGASWRQHEPS